MKEKRNGWFTYAKIFFVDGLVSGPVDIFKLGPLRPRAEGSGIGGALVWIPDREEWLMASVLPHGSIYEVLSLVSDDLPCARKVRQIEYHALGERYLGSSVVLRPMGQTSDQGRPEKIRQLLSVDASRPLK